MKKISVIIVTGILAVVLTAVQINIVQNAKKNYMMNNKNKCTDHNIFARFADTKQTITCYLVLLAEQDLLEIAKN